MKERGIKDDNHKYANDAADGQDEFPLYTEKIVVNPFVKYKKVIAVIRFIVLAVIFGLIASFVMVIVSPKLQKQGNKQEPSRDSLVLDKDEYPSNAIMDETQAVGTYPNPPAYGTQLQPETQENESDGSQTYTYAEIVKRIQKSVFVVTDGSTASISQPAKSSAEGETVGVVVGQLGGRYLLLTSKTGIESYRAVYIKLDEDTEIKAEPVGADRETDLAMLAFSTESLSEEKKELVSVAALDNSYVVQQGDEFVAVGKLDGKVKEAERGFVTGIGDESGTDNCFGTLNTGIMALKGDYCFIFNLSGNVIGVSQLAKKEERLVALGISDMKTLIEKLSSRSGIPYFGIKGQNVTASMAKKYNLPYGVYVSEVIIDSPAFYAGIQAGDVITGFGGEITLAMQHLNEKLFSCVNNQTVDVTVKRPGVKDYKVMQFKAVLGTR